MMDYFTEYIVRRKKSAIDILIIAGIIIAALVLSFIGLQFCFFPLIGQFVFLLIAGVIWGAWFLITNRNVEFEYIVTNGELDVDKITARRKRKRLLSVPAKEIELIAPISDHSADTVTNIIDASRNVSNDESLCYLIAVKDGVRTKLIFNPSEKMIKIFKKFRPQAVKVSVPNE